MEVMPQEGNWNIDTFQKLQQEDDPRDKWAKILLRMEGNIHGVKLQPRRFPHHHTIHEGNCVQKRMTEGGGNRENDRNKKRRKNNRNKG